jgi:enolase
VRQAVAHVQGEMAPAVAGYDAADQSGLDRKLIELDGTPTKARLGANAVLSVSMAAARAAAQARGLPLYLHLGGAEAQVLPVPMMNVLNGGAHTNWTTVAMQEFMLVPVGARTLAEALRSGSETYQALKALLKSKNLNTGVGDEGGFAPSLTAPEAVRQLLVGAI